MREVEDNEIALEMNSNKIPKPKVFQPVKPAEIRHESTESDEKGTKKDGEVQRAIKVNPNLYLFLTQPLPISNPTNTKH